MEDTEDDVFSTVAWKGSAPVKPAKRGKRVRSKNSRHKSHTCTFCGSPVQNLSRHYRNVHSKPGELYIDPKDIQNAQLANKIRLVEHDVRSDLITCPLCKQPRKRLREHLIAAHKLDPTSNELEALLPPKCSWSAPISPHMLEISMSIEDFSETFSNNLAGSKPRLKQKSFDDSMKEKARSIRFIMGFISESTGQTKIFDCLDSIDIIGEKTKGFITKLIDGSLTGNTNKYATAKKHLSNFQDFLRYMMKKAQSDRECQIVSYAKESTLRIMKNLSPYINNQDLERRLAEETLEIGEASIENYRKTSKAKEGDEILLGKEPVSLAKAVQARDHLITVIILENCARPSELTDLKMADMEAGVDVTNQATGEREMSYVSTLGKVGAMGQPAFLLLKSETESKLRGYLKRCNPVLRHGKWADQDEKNVPVFLTMKGGPMDDQAISNAWRRAWKRSGKECPDIPSQCKSRHLRTTGNDVVWVHGDETLQRTIHLSFAHSKKVNKSNYRNKSRRILAIHGKQKMLALRKVHTSSKKIKHYPNRKRKDKVDTQISASQPENNGGDMCMAAIQTNKADCMKNIPLGTNENKFCQKHLDPSTCKTTDPSNEEQDPVQTPLNLHTLQEAEQLNEVQSLDVASSLNEGTVEDDGGRSKRKRKSPLKLRDYVR